MHVWPYMYGFLEGCRPTYGWMGVCTCVQRMYVYVAYVLDIWTHAGLHVDLSIGLCTLEESDPDIWGHNMVCMGFTYNIVNVMIFLCCRIHQ